MELRNFTYYNPKQASTKGSCSSGYSYVRNVFPTTQNSKVLQKAAILVDIVSSMLIYSWIINSSF